MREPFPEPDGFYPLQPHLLRAVPADAARVLVVGCGEGRLGVALKAQATGRVVYGVEQDPRSASEAAGRLDRVFALHPDWDDVPLPPGSLDLLVYPDLLSRLTDPLGVLRRHRRLLRPGGAVLCGVPNAQHHALLLDLLKADWPGGWQPGGTPLHAFTYGTAIKVLLDAGLAPRIVGVVKSPGPDDLYRALAPLLSRLGLHASRTRGYLDASHYLLHGHLLPDALDDEESGENPLTFAVCVSDEGTLRANLLASPCLRPGTRHEVLTYRGCRSAADGLNRALAEARHPVVVCVHQDAYLPRGWARRFWRGWRQAQSSLGPVGVAGVYGVSLRGGNVVRAGHVIDRDRLLREPPELPAAADTLDELLLAVHRDSGLLFEPSLGFHFYGADICLQARGRGLTAVALDALCLHHSRGLELPPEFESSGRDFARKWASSLPVATSCVVVGAGWPPGG